MLFFLGYASLQILLGFWKMISRVLDILLEALSHPLLDVLSIEWSGPFICHYPQHHISKAIIIDNNCHLEDAHCATVL